MRRLYELDSIRGVAALIVFAHHWLTLTGHAGLGIVPGLAVDVFFVLSGFVMARTYEGRMRDGSLSALGFLHIRYRRLFLPLAIGSTIGLIRVLALDGPSLSAFGSYALMLAFLPTIWLGNVFWLNLPAWSLFLEIIANAIHSLLLARLSQRTLVSIMVGCGSAACGLMVSGLGHWGYNVVAIVSCLPRELAFYLAGIVAFRHWGDAPFRMKANPVAAFLGALSYPLYAVHVPVMLLLAGWSPVVLLCGALSVALIVTALAEVKPRARSLVGDRLPSFRWGRL